MKCPICKRRELDLDLASNTYFCAKCGMLSPEDVVGDISDITNTVTNIDTYKCDNELNGLTLFLINFLQSLPIFDFITTMFVLNSDCDEKYKKAFSYRIASRVITAVMAAMILFAGLKYFKMNYQNEVSKAVVKVIRISNQLNKIDREVPNFKSLANLESKKEEAEKQVIANDEVQTPIEPDWKYMEGAILSGTMIHKILDDSSNYPYAYLIQNRSVAEKYGVNTYRNVGYILNKSKFNEEIGNYFFEGKQFSGFQFYKDDYGEYVTDSTEDLDVSKYIYYLNPTKQYRLNILYSVDGKVCGFLAKEVYQEE